MFKKIYGVIRTIAKKVYGLIVFLLCWCGLAAIALVGSQTILMGDTTGTHTAMIACDRACYDALGLEGSIQYTEGMTVYAERDFMICNYLTLEGKRTDTVWNSYWSVKERPGNWDEMPVYDWPVKEDLSYAGELIREPEYGFEFGCRTGHPDWVPLEDRFGYGVRGKLIPIKTDAP
ncbi:MAG: hypothetical protein KDC54_12120 [Lewinella sp.]|nr:hypothetical protein [Lewinella sp.]